MLFMMGAMQHGRASNEMYERATVLVGASMEGSGALKQLLAGRGVPTAMWLRRIILDYSSVAMFAVPVLMQVLPRSTTQEPQTVDGMDPTTMNTMGLMQWGIILQFAVYFCTYTADICSATTLDVATHRSKKDDD